jgi:hypothetical protein
MDQIPMSALLPAIDWNDAYYGGRNLLPPDVLIRKTAKSPKSTAL